MANLPPNSFLKPVEPVQASPYQRIDPKALGGLQPLFSDLIQTNAPKNKFLAETYAADPNAIQSRMGELGTGRFAPTYSTDKSLFYGADALQGVNEPAGADEYLKKINALRTKTETWTPSAEQLASRKRWDYSPLRPDPSLGYREISTGDEFGRAGQSIWTRQVQDTPLTYTDFMKEYGATPSEGWSDANTKQRFSLTRIKDKPPLQRWMDDPSYLPTFSFLGSGSPEDIQRGFNLLQRMSPQNIDEFWSLSPEVQRGMLANPAAALQQMRAMANPANHDWLSVGAEGGFGGFDAYKWDPQRGLTADPSRYLQIDDSNNGLLGSLNSFMNKVDPLNGAIENAVGKALGFDSGLDMVRGIGEPVGNIAGAVFSGGIPWGSIVMAADNISTGNDKALMGNLISGVGSYAGANMPTGSVAGTGYSLGSNAANAAANQALMSAASTAVRGGNFSDILKNAAISGLGSYGGGVMGGMTKNLSPLAKMAAQTAYGSGVGGLSSAIQGKGFSRGATNAARRGITNAAFNAALNSQLYKGLV